MTGKEILEEEFEKAGMRGYRAEQVDVFLQKVAAYVDEQEEAKNDLTYKIQILADKIEEYKRDEENIREALLGAQKLGAQVLNEARAKADELTRESRSAADDMLAQAKAKVDSMTRDSLQKANLELSTMKRECDMEQRRLESIKQEVSAFRASILKQYKQHLALLSNLPSVEETEPRPAPAPVPQPERIVEPEPPAATLEKPEPEVSAPPVTVEPRREEPETPRPQTIKSDVLADEDEADIEKEEREQTKEFGSDKRTFRVDIKGEDEDKSESAPRRAARPNYIEKFGELKFGGFGENDK